MQLLESSSETVVSGCLLNSQAFTCNIYIYILNVIIIIIRINSIAYYIIILLMYSFL